MCSIVDKGCRAAVACVRCEACAAGAARGHKARGAGTHALSQASDPPGLDNCKWVAENCHNEKHTFLNVCCKR